MKRHACALVTMAMIGGTPVALANYDLGRVGDSSGAPNSGRTLACRADERIVGLKIRAGRFVDQLTLLCQKVEGSRFVGSHRDGPVSPIVKDAPSLFVGVSSEEEVKFCPNDHILAGIKARGGDYVDRIMSMRCVRYGGSEVAFIDVGMGGTGGRIMRPYCRNADRVSAIRTFSGLWLDQMVLRCSPNDLQVAAKTAPSRLPSTRRPPPK